MPINRIELKDFLAFQGEFAAEFSSGINVFIGGNSTGKTTLLKALYMPYTWNEGMFLRENDPAINRLLENGPSRIRELFCAGKSCDDTSQEMVSKIKYFFAEGDFSIECNRGLTKVHLDDEARKDLPALMFSVGCAVYIPIAEMLSHSESFISLCLKYQMPFDKTEIDISVNAGLPEAKQISPVCEELLKRISKIIDGEILFENDRFYVLKTSGLKIEYSLEASGFQKLGLLWKLLRNGLLQEGSTLLWDEPEASINPELLPDIADILLDLQRNGIQVFIATHNYNLARYLDIKKTKNDHIAFFNFAKTNNSITATQSTGYTTLTQNILRDADQALFDSVVQHSMKETDNESNI